MCKNGQLVALGYFTEGHLYANDGEYDDEYIVCFFALVDRLFGCYYNFCAI